MLESKHYLSTGQDENDGGGNSMTASHSFWKSIVFVSVSIGLVGVLVVLLIHYLPSRSPAVESYAEFEGGYQKVLLDTGVLENNGTEVKLLHRVKLAHPDPDAVIVQINVKGTVLGKDSFVRVKRVIVEEGSHLERFETEDYRAEHFRFMRSAILVGGSNPLILELWGAPRTQNRLRVEDFHYYYPGRPIKPKVAPGEPVPA
jgi:hypothetical protein